MTNRVEFIIMITLLVILIGGLFFFGDNPKLSPDVEDLIISLSKSVYGVNQNFEGSFTIVSDESGEYSVNENIDVSVDCDSESYSDSFSLFEVLNNSHLFFGSPYTYERGSSVSSGYGGPPGYSPGR